jgi:hypothetical protein
MPRFFSGDPIASIRMFRAGLGLMLQSDHALNEIGKGVRRRRQRVRNTALIQIARCGPSRLGGLERVFAGARPVKCATKKSISAFTFADKCRLCG